MEFLIGCAALWVLWLLLPKRSQKHVRFLFLVIIITLCFSPLGLALASWEITASLPQGSGEPINTIAILTSVILERGEHLRDLRVIAPANFGI